MGSMPRLLDREEKSTLGHQTPKPRSNNNQADLKDKSSIRPSLSAVFPASSLDLGCDPRDRNAAVLVTLITSRAVARP
jgi:hypothetical protein